MGVFDRFLGPPNRDKFARMMIDSIVAAGETRSLEYDSEQFRLTCDNQHFHLSNAYEEYCAASNDIRDAYIKRYTRGWFLARKEIPDAFEDARPDVLLKLRNRSYFERMRLHCLINDIEFSSMYRVISPHLAVGLVYDLPEAVAEVNRTRLDVWDISFDAALEVAIENLWDISREGTFVVLDDSVYVSGWRDTYDASRILLDELVLHLEVAGDPVALVPHRDMLIVTGSQDTSGLSLAAKLAEDAFGGPRPLSGIAIRRDPSGQWIPFLPPVDHPEYRRFRLLEVQTLGQAYNDVKKMLEDYHEQIGDDVFVATYTAVEDKSSSEVSSYCVWTQGCQALLPRTDKVAFVRQDDDNPVLVDWCAVEADLGGLMIPVEGMYPERFRVEEFPSEAQLAALS